MFIREINKVKSTNEFCEINKKLKINNLDYINHFGNIFIIFTKNKY